MLKRGEYTQMLLDKGRNDYALRVGNGEKLNIRGTHAFGEMFKDGLKVDAKWESGAWHLELRNRASGYTVSHISTGGIKHVHTSLPAPDRLPAFGTVAPLEVIHTRNGSLTLIMPAELPPVREQNRQKNKVPKAKAAKVAAKPTAEAHESTEAPAAVAQQPQPAQEAPTPPTAAVASELPQLELRPAVQAINEWKRLLGDKVQLTLLPDGTLRASAEYA